MNGRPTPEQDKAEDSANELLEALCESGYTERWPAGLKKEFAHACLITCGGPEFLEAAADYLVESDEPDPFDLEEIDLLRRFARKYRKLEDRRSLQKFSGVAQG